MRNKIDYGIDLGTTNSAIARMQNGAPVIIKSDVQKDTMPSCVHFTRKKDIYVGEQAINALKNDNVRSLRDFRKSSSNTFVEFKRTMGTTTRYYSSNMNKEFSSEELSAEVLKKLKSFVKDENISSIVITVPTKFLNPQNEATMQAARLAGFKQVYLLQEPVAAATAYGISSKIKDGYLLVFDFGGGTFDAVLLKSDEGILSIKDTEGDNWLGGKNIDEAIVDQIIIPHLEKNYSLKSILNDLERREILRNAVKSYAEEAKIQLSFKDRHNIISNLGDLPFIDENGEEPEIDLIITQKDIERVVVPIFQKAINITNSLLKRNNLNGNDLKSLILVGGPTYSPILRKMLKEQVTMNVDTSVDPMTVVAKGAALFASTLSISDDLKEINRDKTKLQLDIRYEATTVETDEMVNIKLLPNKTLGKIPEKVFINLIRKPEGFFTGKKQITDKPSLIELILEKNCPNEFEVLAYDNFGNLLECQPNKFTILQGIGGIDSLQVLPYHIGIVKYFYSEEKDLFFPVKGLEKNKSIKSGIIGVADGLKTRRDIRPGVKEDIIRIPIYQGEYNAEGTNPDLNYHITDVIISGETIPKFLPVNSPVNIRIKIDASSLMTFIAEFPTIEHEEEVKIEIKKAEPPKAEELSLKFNQTFELAKKLNRVEYCEYLEKLKKDIDAIGTTEDGRLRLLDEYRKILLELDVVFKENEWIKVEEELKSAFYELEDLINKIKEFGDDVALNMNKIYLYLEEFRKTIDFIIKENNIKKAKELTREINRFDFELRNLLTNNAIDGQFIVHFNEQFYSYNWKNPTKARQLINQGLRMISEGNTLSIRPILLEIINLIPIDQRPETLG